MNDSGFVRAHVKSHVVCIASALEIPINSQNGVIVLDQEGHVVHVNLGGGFVMCWMSLT